MERKLLSLPSFFVLLLIAGITFLAAPVVDVHAALGGTPTVVQTTPAAGATAMSGNVVATITFTAAVKVAGETKAGETAAVTTVDGFGVEDIIVTFNKEDGSSESRRPTSSELAKTDSTPTAGLGTTFTVTVAVPTNEKGNLIIGLRAFVTGSVEFEEDAAPTNTYDATGVVATIAYDSLDTLKPTVTITGGANTGGTASAISVTGGMGVDDIFQLEFEFSEPLGTGAAGFAHADDVSIATTPAPASGADDPSEVVGSWAKPGAAAGTPTFIVVINPADGATKVTVGVKKDAVADVNGNKLDPAMTEDVTINPRPTVTINSTVTVPIDAMTLKFPVTFELSAEPGAGANDGLQATDITVTNGSLEEGSLSRDLTMPPTADVKAIYTAMVVLPDAADRKSPVTVTVKADGVMSAGLGNAAISKPFTVTVTTVPVTTTPTGIGTSLPTGRKGFSVQVTVPANDWTVLAKSPNDSGITGLTPVDVADEAWVDLSDFLATGSGGAIDLKFTGANVKDLVISELMWGNDASKNPSTNSQWIEIYNTTASAITGMLTVEFTDGGNGATMLAVPADKAGPATTTAAPVVDKLTNWGLGENYWQVSDVAGGAYGQGGRTEATVVVSARQLVSMERKINYVDVAKVHDANDAAKNRNKQLGAVPDGARSGSWQASKAPRRNMSGLRLGTPGTSAVVQITKTSISKSVVFNEVANRSSEKDDWLELYNPGSADVKINGWVLSKVTGVGNDKDVELFTFESDENIMVPAKGFLMVVNEDPSETSLSAGENVDNPSSNANGLPTQFYIDSGLNIPKENYLLVLRTEKKLGSDEKIVDIAGHIGNLNLSDDARGTKVWPLKVWEAIQTNDLNESNGNTWVRDKGKNLDHADAWKHDGGVTGLGIDRAATTMNSGTPGYDNGAVKDKVKDLTASDPVVISEIMFGTGNGRVPQWIELYNPSKTQAVKLNGWRLNVRNVSDASEDLNVKFDYELRLPDVRIQPNQTVLVVSASGDSNDDKRFPRDRIISIWSTRSLRDTAEMTSRRDAVLSTIGFYISLSDPDKVMVDEVGNLDDKRNAAPNWPLKGGNLEEGGRSSMVRVSGTEGDGTEDDAWRSAVNTNGGEVGVETLYYGDEDDIGTPGYTPGGPLPVQLSSFYSKRNDAGAVVITWATESELDNAGFNILRGASRTGEFTKINSQLIPGAGTTGEKNTYTWTDTSAKPNVLYFYQIEDVSLDGDRQTLRTTRLYGHVGAAGKATTTWGALKYRE